MPVPRSFFLSLLLLAFGQSLGAEDIELPRGTRFDLALDQPLRSDSLLAGDTFEGTVKVDYTLGGRVVIPAGSTVFGRVTLVRSLSRSGVIGVRFVRLSIDGHVYDIDGVLAPTRDGETVNVTPSKKEAVVLIGGEPEDSDKRASTLVGDIGENTEELAERWSRSGLSPRLALADAGTELTVELREPVDVVLAP
jgi:hypothetical protein